MLSLESIELAVPSGGSPLLSGINLQLPGNHFGAIVGPSGCGKSTLLKTIAGTVVLASGLSIVAYGFTSFPDEALRKDDPGKFHSDNIKAIDFCLSGLVLAAVSIPIYGLHQKRYSVTKHWKIKYQR
mgnify:CR=1 FL=1